MPEAEGPLVIAAPTDAVLDLLPDAADLLTTLEARRMAMLRRVAARRDFLAAHTLARLCAARVVRSPHNRLTLVQLCPTCGANGHGRPSIREIPALHLSLSHTPGYVAAVAGWNPIGVDVERLGRIDVDSTVAELLLTPAERTRMDAAPDRNRAFLRSWVRKEALVKLGVLSLDALTSADLAGLAITEGPRVTQRWRDLFVFDWSDATAGTLGAAVGAGVPRLENLIAG